MWMAQLHRNCHRNGTRSPRRLHRTPSLLSMDCSAAISQSNCAVANICSHHDRIQMKCVSFSASPSTEWPNRYPNTSCHTIPSLVSGIERRRQLNLPMEINTNTRHWFDERTESQKLAMNPNTYRIIDAFNAVDTCFAHTTYTNVDHDRCRLFHCTIVSNHRQDMILR